MDTWEAFFREKSKRRWARHSRQTMMKTAVVALLAISVAAAVVMLVAGLPR